MNTEMNTKLVPCTQLNCTNQTLAPEGTISRICKSCLDRVLGSEPIKLWVQQDDYESDSDDDSDDEEEEDKCICEVDDNGNKIGNEYCTEHDFCDICADREKCKFNGLAWLCADCQKEIDDEREKERNRNIDIFFRVGGIIKPETYS